MPAKDVALPRKDHRAHGRETQPGALLDFGAEPVHAALGDHVFQPGVFAVGAVAGVPVRLQDRAGDVEDALGRHEAERVGHARVGFGVAMAHAEPATDEDVVAQEPRRVGGIGHGHEAEAVRVDVGVVERRDRKGDLELARQILASVERILKRLLLARGELERRAIDPDLVVRRRARDQQGVDLERIGLHLIDERTGRGRGRRHDVAPDVAARRDGRAQRLVQAAHEGAEAVFDDAMPLERLARGEAKRVVAVQAGQLVKREVLGGRDHAAGQARADQVQVLFPGFTLIAVVLLVDAMKFQELLVVVAEALLRRIGEGLGNRARQRGIVELQQFVGGERGRRRDGWIHFQNK
ncbi:MAG: hypothetical protein BWX86_02765 [Verrucomicrobia bacterium ADurb.Bin122]|nr:MAG: hypothetical protein BWX86_02765 [Verrucomicrobia bacterium ADurb.Bin122]